jgi:hypothetical protein
MNQPNGKIWPNNSNTHMPKIETLHQKRKTQMFCLVISPTWYALKILKKKGRIDKKKKLTNSESRIKKLSWVFFNLGSTICVLSHSPKLALLHLHCLIERALNKCMCLIVQKNSIINFNYSKSKFIFYWSKTKVKYFFFVQESKVNLLITKKHLVPKMVRNLL